ncbi:hypothetical protein EPO04_01550 [Patescibacteria group bacterium]|nr:MAG: hypothetical protein EPO04_01550 [Patescibacteria group bacterium]
MRLIGHTAPWTEIRGYDGPLVEFQSGPNRRAKSRQEDPGLKTWLEVIQVEVIILPRQPYYFGFRLSYGPDQKTIYRFERQLKEQFIAPRLGPERLIGVIMPVSPIVLPSKLEAHPRMVLHIDDHRYPNLLVP